MVAASCIEELAKGMMVGFAKYREAVVPLMLERMKERKASVTDTIGTALDAVFATVSVRYKPESEHLFDLSSAQTTLADIIPDLEPSLKSKNPQVKEGTLKFLGRCLSTATAAILPPQVKPLSESLATLLEDSFEGARNEAATCLGTLMKMVGERPMNALMDGLADMRKAKVKEAYEKATIKCKPAGAAAPKAAPPVQKKPIAKKPPAAAKVTMLEDDADPPPKKLVNKPPVKPPVSNSPSR